MTEEESWPLLGEIPLDGELSRRCGAGRIETYDGEAFAPIARQVMKRVPAVKMIPIFPPRNAHSAKTDRGDGMDRSEGKGGMMRIAISTDDSNGLDSIISPHFGRCPYYMLVDMEGQQIKALRAVANPYYGRHEPGQVPHFIESQGAEVMLSGGMGRRAIAAFQHYGIRAITGASGTVRHALAQYLAGALQEAEPCRESVAHAHGDSPAATAYEQDEMGRLREEVEMLQRRLEEARARLDRLTGEHHERPGTSDRLGR